MQTNQCTSKYNIAGHIASGKKQEGRRKREEARRKKEEGRGKKKEEKGRGKKKEGRISHNKP
ncbi:hypothetical protein [Microcoleus sp. CAWBG58]|uniref:hypothetical protein n=1 Tax=Microcoleus sp. CAWBG58 TaxID=2841651 RepID=UPI0025E19BCB|nr:hypothetical protein [Microcoleus sp. CAWBG58]